MSVYQNLKIQIDNNIAIVIINRPDKLNALNNQTLQELKEAVQKICLNEQIKAMIITGSGEKAFVAGADIMEIAELDTTDARPYSENGQAVFKMIEDFPKPVIAAINGFALGGGCELAMACHLRVASKNAKLGLPEVSLGILPGFGGTQRLTFLVGKSKALELMLTGKIIPASDAATIGLVNQVVDKPADLIPACKQWISDILKNAPLSISKVLTSVNAAFGKDGFTVEADCFADLIETDDFTEGTRAFMEKRTPKFKGA